MSFEDALKVAAAALASVTSAGAIILALSSWLGRVWAARILEADRARYGTMLEQLKIEGQKRILVHRVQFETEFEAYREVWPTIAQVVLTALQFRPVIEYDVDLAKSEGERQAEKLQRYGEAANRFLDTARRYHPFLSPEVDEEINTLFKYVQEEQRSFRHSTEEIVGVEAYWEKQKTNSEKIQLQARSVASAIQKRIGLLEVAVDAGAG